MATTQQLLNTTKTMVDMFSMQNANTLIPSYNGQNISLPSYQKRLENINKTLPEDSEEKLVQIALTKLYGKAAEAVESLEIETINDLVECMRIRFSPQRPFSFYQGRLNHLCKFPEEPVYEYGTRAQQYLNCALTGLTIERPTDVAAATPLLKSGAILSFVRGLPPEYSSLVKQDYDSLQKAIDAAIEIERTFREREEIQHEVDRERRLYKTIFRQEEKLGNNREITIDDSEIEKKAKKLNTSQDNSRYHRNTYYREDDRYNPPRHQERYPRYKESYPRDYNGSLDNNRPSRNHEYYPKDADQNFRERKNEEFTPRNRPKYNYEPRETRAPLFFCQICGMNNHQTINCKRKVPGYVQTTRPTGTIPKYKILPPPRDRETPPERPSGNRGLFDGPTDRYKREPSTERLSSEMWPQQYDGEQLIKFVEKHQVLWAPSNRNLPIIHATLRGQPKMGIKLVIDTASGINLINVSSVPENCKIDFEDHVKVYGISPQTVATLGSVTLEFFDIPAKFYLIADGLLSSAHGLLGLEFLTKGDAQVSFYHKTINFNSNPIKPIPFLTIKEADINVPARTKIIEKDKYTWNPLKAKPKMEQVLLQWGLNASSDDEEEVPHKSGKRKHDPISYKKTTTLKVPRIIKTFVYSTPDVPLPETSAGEKLSDITETPSTNQNSKHEAKQHKKETTKPKKDLNQHQNRQQRSSSHNKRNYL